MLGTSLARACRASACRAVPTPAQAASSHRPEATHSCCSAAKHRPGRAVPQRRLVVQATPSDASAGAAQAMATATGASAAEPQVAVITTVGCPYCKATKAGLQAAGIPFVDYELSQQVEVLAAIKAATGQSTVPQIFVGGQLLGGASEVLPLLDSGGLQQLLANTSAPPLPADLRSMIEAAAAAAANAAPVEDAERAGLRQLAAEVRAALATSPARTFTLQQAAQWLQQAKGLTADAAAAQLGQLQAAQLLTVAAPAGSADSELPLTAQLVQWRPQLLLRLPTDAPAPSRWGEPLNGQVAWFGPARPADEVAESLRAAVDALYDKYLVQGKAVAYRRLAADPAWAAFVAATAELQRVDLFGLSSREQRMAFFINVYNALIVHALVAFGPADGTLSRLRWFDSVSYLIGGQRFTSNDVEHGVLRGNRPSPAALFSLLGKPQWAGPTFKAADPRAALAVVPMDPRIHFALNCGAASCPPIRVYTPASLEFGLEAAAAAFVAGEVTVDKGAGRVEASMILKWYGGDFGTKAQLLDFLARHLPPGPAADLRELLAARGADDIELAFRPYDWTINSAD